MTTTKDIQHQKQHIMRLLLTNRLQEALALLEPYLVHTADMQLRMRFEQAKTSYQYLLEYMKNGTKDPERNNLHKDLIREMIEVTCLAALLLSDRIEETSLHRKRASYQQRTNKPSKEDIYAMLKGFTENLSITELDPGGNVDYLLHQREEAQAALFEMVRFSDSWQSQEYEFWNDFIADQLIPETDKILLISAVLLSFSHYFDERKLMWLMNTYQLSDQPRLSERALVAISIAFVFHSNILEYYPKTVARLKLFNEDPTFGVKLNKIYYYLLYAKETPRIEKKIKEELFSPLADKQAMDQLKKRMEDMEEGDDMNPDWNLHIDAPDLSKKIEELSELQEQGADVQIATFSQLKGFPFFNKSNNWLLPFDITHSSIYNDYKKAQEKNTTSVYTFIEGLPFCDSDRYSMCFMIGGIPNSQRQMILEQFISQQVDENEEFLKRAKDNKKNFIANRYIHDLYRFFNLSQERLDFENPFKMDIKLHEIEVLKPILQKKEHLQKIAALNMKNQHYLEALDVYDLLVDLSEPTANLYQMMGFCNHKIKWYEEAIECYLKADILKPNNLWTNRVIANSYRLLHEYDKAISYYKKVEEVQPKNKTVIFYLGYCLAQLKRDSEALHYFFKLDFMEENSTRAWRGISWSSFMSGKHEQALRYYNQLLEYNPIEADYLNAAHLHWCLGNTQEALKLYKSFYSLVGKRDTFITSLYKDYERLEEQGLSREDIPLIYDLTLLNSDKERS